MFKFTYTGACPGSICIVYIIMNKRNIFPLDFECLIYLFIENCNTFRNFTAYYNDGLFLGQIFINEYA